jgi:hypothetical protein
MQKVPFERRSVRLGTSSNPIKALYNAAAEEKQDLICLNDKLADVFDKLSRARTQEDNGPFLKAIACMEDEMKKITMAYECEISKIRQEKNCC